MVESDVADVPEPHTHSFELVDQQGLWGAPALLLATDWPQAPSRTGRTNIEIYNMPIGLSLQSPPLVPRFGISTTPYLFKTGASTREDPSRSFFYPETADRQPAMVFAKSSTKAQFYTRAFCGFEPFLLDSQSHLALTEYIVVRHFRLGHFDR